SRKTTKRVVFLAALGATLYILNFVINLMRGNYDVNYSGSSSENSIWAAFSSLLIELSIPMCGYCGALYHNRQLACCYCSCNLFVAIVSIMSFIRFNIRISEIHGQCVSEPDLQQRRQCEIWVSESVDKYVMLFSTMSTIFMGFFAFWTGNILYNKLAQ
ncbi:unnamed protein product, partial [Polarella glacialis]